MLPQMVPRVIAGSANGRWYRLFLDCQAIPALKFVKILPVIGISLLFQFCQFLLSSQSFIDDIDRLQRRQRNSP